MRYAIYYHRSAEIWPIDGPPSDLAIDVGSARLVRRRIPVKCAGAYGQVKVTQSMCGRIDLLFDALRALPIDSISPILADFSHCNENIETWSMVFYWAGAPIHKVSVDFRPIPSRSAPYH